MPLFLLVEDDPGTLQLFAAIVQREYHNSRLLQATDVNGALRLMISDVPDVILLDLALPGRNGLDLLDQVNQTPPLQAAKIIIITAHNDLSREAKRRGVAAVLIKPVRPKELLDVIRSVLQ